MTSHFFFRARRLAPALVLALVAGCGGDDTPPPAGGDSSDPATLTYADELDVEISAMTRTASGLYILDEATGEGEPVRAGNSAVVHYTGWLPSGMKFDSSVDRNEPFTVSPVGGGTVIAGWDEGLQGMRPGGRRLLVIPPNLGYGASGTPGGPIPPNATLVFRVELLQVLP
jgi:FKBP-type peptidyl-prolyl cis-trans isomerase